MTRYNFFSRCTCPMCLERQTGFSIIAAIFLLVVLALLAAFIASVTGMQQSSGQLDVLGVRAYQSARAGMEWGAYQVLDPNNTLNRTDCTGTTTKPTMPVCPGAGGDRKSTRLNSSHGYISYAVFCLKKKKKAASHVHKSTRDNCSNAACIVCG